MTSKTTPEKREICNREFEPGSYEFTDSCAYCGHYCLSHNPPISTKPENQEESPKKPQWECDLAIIMGKLVGWREADFDQPLIDFVRKVRQQTLEEQKLEEARSIAIAANQAGLAPRELTSPEDWKKEVEKIRDEVCEKITGMDYETYLQSLKK